ncbi:lysoplasmalogenase [Paenibacillus herberti]|uniref:Lysoplasmalogenase n=1 Tax=Paenibacillus herberti TaxID=1619309 RepID=A0A229NV75_9BACL|nr:lysoplasmalogenase [Paenibacillus herberti]
MKRRNSTLPKYMLPLLIALMGLIYIFAIPAEPEGIKLVFKLIPMALIITYGWLRMPKQRKPWHWILLAGLFICSIGDGTIRWFVIGLSAFLIGHLFYIPAFFSRFRFSPLRLATILPIGVYSAFMGSRLVEALLEDGRSELIAPVMAYIIVISLMAWSAIMTGNKTVIAGGLLFVLSDSILSWNMFVSEIAYSHALIMLTYYSAQFLIATSLRESNEQVPSIGKGSSSIYPT